MRDTEDDVARLASLAAELCDAHLDTIYMARDDDVGLDWILHVEYLKSLRRVAERTLASTACPAPSGVQTQGTGD